MKHVRILFSQDCNYCECCGHNYDDYGIELWLNDEKLIDNPAIASCIGNGSNCYSGIDQLNLIAYSLKIPISKFYKLDNEWSEDERESDEYYDYYSMIENNMNNIIKRVLTEYGYSVEITNKRSDNSIELDY